MRKGEERDSVGGSMRTETGRRRFPYTQKADLSACTVLRRRLMKWGEFKNLGSPLYDPLRWLR